MLWVFATLIAVGAQTARNAMQSSLTATLGTLGATQVRFLYGLPFALLFLGVVVLTTGAAIPPPSARFFAFLLAGAVAQTAATACLLAAMRERAFAVAVAFSKTDVVQVAVFGLIVLGDALTWALALAIGLATAGVMLMAKGERWDAASLKPALYGIASGALFAVGVVGFRGAILALGETGYLIRATATLAWSLAAQTLMLGAWLAVFKRDALAGGFRLWRTSLPAGFAGALASQFWFLALALTSAVNVRTLGLIEVLVAQVVSLRVFRQRTSARELAGMALIVAGVAVLLVTS